MSSWRKPVGEGEAEFGLGDVELRTVGFGDDGSC